MVALAGCGRVAFDPVAARAGDAAAADVAVQPDAATIPPGAKIWLQMETDPSVAIVDSAGGHQGACNSGCPQRVAGVHGSGWTFTQQEIDFPYAADLDTSAGFTGAIWVDIASAPTSTACFWTKPFDNVKGYDSFTLCIDTSGNPMFDGEAVTGMTDSETVPPPLTLDQWHHLAFSWDGTTKRGYVDGVLQVMVPINAGAGTDPVQLGGSRAAYYLDGKLDDAVYYTRALSAAEIAQLATP